MRRAASDRGSFMARSRVFLRPSTSWGLTSSALRSWLDAPVKRVNMGEALIAYSPPLEDGVLPNVERIMMTVRDVMR